MFFYRKSCFNFSYFQACLDKAYNNSPGCELPKKYIMLSVLYIKVQRLEIHLFAYSKKPI